VGLITSTHTTLSKEFLKKVPMKFTNPLASAYQILNSKAARTLRLTPRGPLIVFLALTERCNLRCKNCTIWKGVHKKKESELSGEEIFSLLSQLSSMGTKIVALWGGEPLLNKHLREIIREIHRLGMAPYLVTNGLLLNEENVVQLLEADVGSLSVSLDHAFPEKHDEAKGVKGTFARACQGIALLRERGGKKINLGINMVVSKDNVKEIFPMAELAISLKLNWLKFIPVHFGFPYNQMAFGDEILMPNEEEIASIQDNLLAARSYLIKHGLYTNSRKFLKGFGGFFKGTYHATDCYAGYLLCNVDSYGNVTQCSPDPRITGNIREQSFTAIWKSGEFDRIRNDHTQTLCGHCWLSCYLEPSFRMSFIYSLENLSQLLTEISLVR
jgi:MoaA/NifB/PqqE/SkfB family radical SAM enzyme